VSIVHASQVGVWIPLVFMRKCQHVLMCVQNVAHVRHLRVLSECERSLIQVSHRGPLINEFLYGKCDS